MESNEIEVLEHNNIKSKKNNRKVIKNGDTLLLGTSISVVFITLVYCLNILFSYDIIGSYSKKVLVKITVQAISLEVIAGAYMPELDRKTAIEKIMNVNHYQSKDLVLLKGDQLMVPMHSGSRTPPRDMLFATVKRIEANNKYFKELRMKEAAEEASKLKTQE